MAFEFNPIKTTMYRIEGGWEEMCADIMEIWGALTHEDLAIIEADHNKLVARLKIRYGISTAEAEKIIDEKLSEREKHHQPKAPA